METEQRFHGDLLLETLRLVSSHISITTARRRYRLTMATVNNEDPRMVSHEQMLRRGLRVAQALGQSVFLTGYVHTSFRRREYSTLDYSTTVQYVLYGK